MKTGFSLIMSHLNVYYDHVGLCNTLHLPNYCKSLYLKKSLAFIAPCLKSRFISSIHPPESYLIYCLYSFVFAFSSMRNGMAVCIATTFAIKMRSKQQYRQRNPCWTGSEGGSCTKYNCPMGHRSNSDNLRILMSKSMYINNWSHTSSIPEIANKYLTVLGCVVGYS